ncbi:hypothetical protein ABBQ38_014602 [Trebouxia sp. C0009 RCD-2024]
MPCRHGILPCHTSMQPVALVSTTTLPTTSGIESECHMQVGFVMQHVLGVMRNEVPVLFILKSFGYQSVAHLHDRGKNGRHEDYAANDTSRCSEACWGGHQA